MLNSNRIQAMAPILGPSFWGPFFKGIKQYLPQNFVLGPRLETDRKSFQKHVHFPLLELLPLSLNSPLDQC